MYGFIEKEFATILVELNIISSYENFAISDGTTIAIVDASEFHLTRDALRSCANTYGWSDEDVVIIPSDVSGMKTILHPFWFNDLLFDSITPGTAKESDLYIRIRRNQSEAIFSHDEFLNNFKDKVGYIINNPDEAAADTGVTEEVAAEPEPTPVETADVEFVKKLSSEMGISLKPLSLSDGRTVYAHRNSGLLNRCIYDIAKITGKHVIVLDRHFLTIGVKAIYKFINNELRDKIIFIHSAPHHSKLYLTTKTSHSVFGFDISNIHQLHGDTHINDNHNPENPHPLGPVFAGFDYVYRDYKTGVIWALQRKNEVFFMFDIMPGYLNITSTILKELGDRYSGSLSYEEMLKRDIAYFEMSSKNDKNQFLKLVATNSKHFIEELRSKYLEAKEAYLEHMGKAMEYAKVSQRLEENLMIIDENKLAAEEEKRCTKMYEDVMMIPKVSAVKIGEKEVNIYTKNIYVFNENTKKFHDVGTFHISIGMYDTAYDPNNTVKILNTKHQIHAFNETMQAPHVFEDGHICHGNIVGSMIDAYKRRDLYQMVLMLIMFLESANLDDQAGAYLYRWPIVTDEAAKSCEMKDEFVKIFEKQTEEELKFDEMLDIPIHI